MSPVTSEATELCFGSVDIGRCYQEWRCAPQGAYQNCQASPQAIPPSETPRVPRGHVPYGRLLIHLTVSLGTGQSPWVCQGRKYQQAQMPSRCLLKIQGAKHRSVRDVRFHGSCLAVHLTFVHCLLRPGKQTSAMPPLMTPVEAGNPQQVFLENFMGGFMEGYAGQGWWALMANGGHHLQYQYSRSCSSSREGSI